MTTGTLFAPTIESIPQIIVSDGPHGLRKQDESCDQSDANSSIKVVCFPTACASSCCFNPELLEQIGQALGDEVRHE